MPAADYRSLVRLIDQLYAGALDPTQWPKFLTSVATLFDAQNAFVCQLRDRRVPIQYISLSQRNRDALPVARYSTLIDQDPRAQRFSTSVGQPVHCGMGVAREIVRGSRAYREYLKPLDIEYTMVLVFPAEEAGPRGRGRMRGYSGEGVTHDLGLTRGSSGKAFDAADCDLLSEISSHVQRAFTIQRSGEERNALRSAPCAAQALLPAESILPPPESTQHSRLKTAALDALSYGMIIADSSGKIVIANAAAELLSASGNGIVLGDRNAGVGAVVKAQAEALVLLVRDAAQGGHGGALRLTDRSGVVTQMVLVTPLPRTFGYQNGHALIALRPVSEIPQFTLAQLTGLFGLSPAQAEIAIQLYQGLSVDEIARDRGIKMSTMRTHLLRIFLRTGAEDQRDLMRLLGSLPALRTPEL